MVHQLEYKEKEKEKTFQVEMFPNMKPPAIAASYFIYRCSGINGTTPIHDSFITEDSSDYSFMVLRCTTKPELGKLRTYNLPKVFEQITTIEINDEGNRYGVVPQELFY